MKKGRRKKPVLDETGPYSPSLSNVVFKTTSEYQEIVVADDPVERTRYLHSERLDIIQGAMRLDDPDELLLEYNRNSLIGLALLESEARSVLLAGLGAGSLPGFVHRLLPRARVEVVELDPVVVEVARTYFNFDPSIPVHVSDARAFLEASKKRYDAIFLDCFIGPDIPGHLLTLEFLTGVRLRLRPGGVAVANMQPVETNPLSPSVVETFQAVFPRVHLFSSLESANVILVAVRSPAGTAPPTFVPAARNFERRTGQFMGLLGTAEREFFWLSPAPPPPILRD